MRSKPGKAKSAVFFASIEAQRRRGGGVKIPTREQIIQHIMLKRERRPTIS